MMAATKSMIALGFASAMFLGNPSPTLAANVHARAQAPEIGTPWQGYPDQRYRNNGKGPYARAVPPQYGYERAPFTPPYRSEQTWDPYGQRWDSAE